MRVYVDHTHLWRHVTGIERITMQLFSPDSLAPIEVVPIAARSMGGMLFKQSVGLPAQLARSSCSVLLCPGFPPAPLLHLFDGRTIPYIHDVFLLSRRTDLNWRAKLYMALPFALAVQRLPRFMVNSLDTAAKLARYCRDDAEIMLYRPPAPNNFGLRSTGRAARPARPAPLRLVTVGTVEPRKNVVAAAHIVAALRERGFPNASLEVIGRRGWGGDWAELERSPGVTLHGYLSEAAATVVLDRADALICTSHEEGLGLPLLEAQYAGLPVIAPDQPVFREVLDRSGILIDPGQPRAAAEIIFGALAGDDWRQAFVARSASNLRRWNDLAASDRGRVIERLNSLVSRRRPVEGLQTAN